MNELSTIKYKLGPEFGHYNNILVDISLTWNAAAIIPIIM